MAESGDKEFKISSQEAAQLREALKKEEFRQLLAEYAQEIADPENKKKYEEELIELEKQRGVDMKFIHPTPGFVMKIFFLPELTKKAFINICHSENVAVAAPSPSHSKSKKKRKKKGENWSIPFSLTPPREDLDKANNKCTVYDVIFNPETYQKGQENPAFKRMLVDTALDSIEKQMKVKLDRANVIYLRMPYKGTPVPTVLRKKTDEVEEPPMVGPMEVPFPPLKEELETLSQQQQQQQKIKKKAAAKKPTEPEYFVVHRGEMDMQDFTNERESTLIKRPKELVVSIKLPDVESIAKVDLEIYTKRMVLQCPSPHYELDLGLPYPVDEDKGTAKFDKSKKVLTVTLPVLPLRKPQNTPLLPQKSLITELSPAELEEKTVLDSTSPSHSEHDDDEIDMNSKVELHNGLVENGPSGSPDKDTTPTTQEATGKLSHVTADWSSKDVWTLPPFSFQQDESIVRFLLYSPGVREQTVVKLFDKHIVQITYKTSIGKCCSFYLSFPEHCFLDTDDCSLDISEENVLLLLKKEDSEEALESQDGGEARSDDLLWDKFSVGINASHTFEKQFLTVPNVQSAIENITDQWNQSGVWSDSAKVKAKLSSEDCLEVAVDDPSRGSGVSENHLQDSADDDTLLSNQRTTDEHQMEDTSTERANDNQDLKPEEKLIVENGHDIVESSSNATIKSKVDMSSESENINNTVTKETGSSESCSQTKNGVKATLSNGSSSVKVEKDGSVFIRAEEDYVSKRSEIAAALRGGANDAGGVKLSNKLMFSLD